MNGGKIQQVWLNSHEAFDASGRFQSEVQRKASRAILYCKSGKLGANVSECPDCGHVEFHNNSCRNRNCPCCQAVQKELWVDKRGAEVIDAPYHVHMHCIVSGGGLTPDRKIRKAGGRFFIPVRVLRDKFKGKYLAGLDSLYKGGKLAFSSACEGLRDTRGWAGFRDGLYKKEWCPYIKETFNGFGNAMEYLGRYTHKIAISNSRILSVDERRVIFSIQGRRRFKERYANLSMAELLKAAWDVDVHLCPKCGRRNMRHVGRTYGTS